MIKHLTLLAVILSFVLGVHGQQAPARRVISEDQAIDTIMKLPEVKERDAYVRKQTKGKRGMAAMISDRPRRDRPYFWVSVGENSEEHFVTHFNFYVYANGGKILFYDTINDAVIDLRTWQKNRKIKP